MDNTVTKKFQYGAGFGEIVNEQLVIEQMRARNFLRNSLVELDRKSREQYNAILNVANPAHDRIQEIDTAIETLRQVIKMLRVAKSGGKSGKNRIKVGPCVEKERIDALKKERADLKPLAIAKRLENKRTSRELLSKLDEERRITVNALYNRAIAGYTDERVNKLVPPLYNLNAAEIVQQHDTERSRAMKDKTQLRFHSFQGEGRSFASVHSKRDDSEDGARETFKQFMVTINGLKEQRKLALKNNQSELSKRLSSEITAQKVALDQTVPNLIGQSEEETFSGESTRFRLSPVQLTRDTENPTVWDKSVPRGNRRQQMRTVAQIRIQSTDKGKPVFLTIPIVMHRPLPQDAKILSAAVNREKIGSKFRWNVEFTVRYIENPRLRESEGTVAIDIGWAKDSLPLPDGRIRVAGLRERIEGVETFTEFCLPPAFLERTQKLDELQSIRDIKTNECFAAIAEYRERNEIEDQELRELLDEAKRSLTARAGKTPPVHHLRQAVWLLRKREQQTICLDLQAILETWYKRWMHLNEWLQNGRDNVLAWKKDYYRRFAYSLAQHNKLLLLDADNFARMAKKPDSETDKNAIKNELRQGVAPGMLRSALEASFEQTLWSSLASSKTCRACLHVNEPLGAGRKFACAECGHTNDRESNATGNIMDEFLRKPGTFASDKNVCAKLAEKKEQEALAISKLSKDCRAN